MTIWKYTLNRCDDVIKVPKRATILSLQSQFEECVIWFLVNPENSLEERRFKTYATGEEIKVENINYTGTYQIRNGSIVLHVFEVIYQPEY